MTFSANVFIGASTERKYRVERGQMNYRARPGPEGRDADLAAVEN